MQQRPLGNSGLTVSVLGLGTVKLGRVRGLKYPSTPVALPSDEQVLDLLRTAAELGINVLDTAPAYGVAEARLGELLARERWLGGRDRWVVVTKAGEEFDDAVGRSMFDFSAAAITASVERSLTRLRLDVLDVVLLHSDGRDEWVVRDSGGFDALERLKAQGKVRAIGASTKSVAGGCAAIARGSDVVMVTLNPDHLDERPVIEAARRAGVGVLIKKALGSGRVGHAASALQLATRTDGVSCVVVGTSSAANLRGNAAAIAGSA